MLAKAQLGEAILAFEAEVQRHPDNAEAWRLLGQTHAQNDKVRLQVVCVGLLLSVCRVCVVYVCLSRVYFVCMSYNFPIRTIVRLQRSARLWR